MLDTPDSSERDRRSPTASTTSACAPAIRSTRTTSRRPPWRRSPQPGASRLRSLERAASLWGGEPLPEERYSDWALGWRERLTDLHVAVLAALADEYMQRGDLIAAGLRARELVELDPLHEGAHRRLMLAYARAGRRSHALRQFLACRRALVEQLGVEPATETTYLQQRILAGEAV